MKIHRFTCFLLSLLLCLALCGCDGGFKADKAFTYVLPMDVSTLDPQTASGASARLVIGSLFEGLCRVDEEGEPVPGVAKSWEKNDNATEFTFYLRKDAKWSNGTAVTADDFLFAIQRALRTETATPGVDDLFVIRNARQVYTGAVSEDELGVIAEDERTLIIKLEQSYEDFPSLTAGLHFMPCNREYFEESAGHYGISSEYLISNGPFAFSSSYAWSTESGSRSLSLSRNEYYKGEEDVLPASLSFLIDYDESIDTEPVAALVNGSVDVLTLPEETAILAQKQNCGVEILEDSVTGLLLNAESEKLQSQELRSLFFQILDRNQILARRDDASDSGASGIMPNCVRWNGEAYYADGAQLFTRQDDTVTDGMPSILARIGLEETPSITILCPDDPESVNIANGFLVCWNNKLNTAFNIEPVPQAELDDRIAAGEYEAALYTLRAGGTSPYSVLKSFLSTATPCIMSNESFDQALQNRSFDLNSYRALETEIMDYSVFYPLFPDKTYYVTNPAVKNIIASPDMGVSFTQARKK